jgi:putative hydrolase of the HAD superfamily
MRRQLVILDLDGTLCDYKSARPYGRAAIRDELETARVSAHDFAVALDEAGTELKGGLEAGLTKQLEYNAARFRLCMRRLGVREAGSPRLAAAVQRKYEDGILDHIRWMEGAEAGFHAVAARHRTAVLTNGAVRLQREKVIRLGIEHHIEDTLFISDETGLIKPDVRAFHNVLERLGTRPEDAVMVGDSLRKDITPAVAVGMRAILVTPRPVAHWHGESLRTVGQLPTLLDRGLA